MLSFKTNKKFGLILCLLITTGCEKLPMFGKNLSQSQASALKSEITRLKIENGQIHPDSSISFLQDVKPILDRKCVACHSCYDAPCQLKLSSYEGLTRGATKIPIYDGTRLESIKPTRLFIDATSEEEWRKKDFFSVLDSTNQPSLFQKILALGKTHQLSEDSVINESILKLGTARELSCPTSDHFSDYANDNPNGGMPLAVAGLTDKEYSILTQWNLNDASNNQDTAGNSFKISDRDRTQIDSWEKWLNQDSKKQKLLSRYIYEHLILGDLYLESDDEFTARLSDNENENENELNAKQANFYKLIRSFTPPGKMPEIIATDLANEPPSSNFYYRLIPITQTIVYKNHIPYRFDKARRTQLIKLFSSEAWQVDSLPGYQYEFRANPFRTFEAIPAKLRYNFLLSDAEFFVRTFIRGPVCHGPIATNVIREQFWVMFENPEHEQYVNNDAYRANVTPLLGLPGEKDDLSEFGDQWEKYSEKRNQYIKLRNQHHSKIYVKGPSLEHIWNGDQKNGNAFLTVFRNYDNASVTRGWRGNIPRTSWVMDYPLLERSYYELVVSFNVFGSVSHQLQTRLYFDLIRNGGELNFLRFIPSHLRQPLYDDWYQGAAKLKIFGSYHQPEFNAPVNIDYQKAVERNSQKDKFTKDPALQFYSEFFRREPRLTYASEYLHSNFSNKYLQDIKASITEKPPKYFLKFNPLRKKTMAQLPFINFMPESTLLTIKENNQSSFVYSIIRNRIHSNVAFMLGESLRYQESKDSLTILPELIASYPNLMLSVNADQLDNMISDIRNVKNQKDFNQFIDQYGVRRMQTRFWDVLHSFSNYLDKTAPIESGIMDINRYGYW